LIAKGINDGVHKTTIYGVFDFFRKGFRDGYFSKLCMFEIRISFSETINILYCLHIIAINSTLLQRSVQIKLISPNIQYKDFASIKSPSVRNKNTLLRS